MEKYADKLIEQGCVMGRDFGDMKLYESNEKAIIACVWDAGEVELFKFDESIPREMRIPDLASETLILKNETLTVEAIESFFESEVV